MVEERLLPGDGHALTVEIWSSYSEEVSSVDLYRLLRRRDWYRTELLEFMEHYDAVLCPAYPCPAPPHGSTAGVGLRELDQRDAISYTTPFSLTGAPCVVIPYGRSPEGLPIGVQIVARPWSDDVALALASELEAAQR
jgi:Asp-tRNA(Asn)/Glu-tRNA(Gln) amidotransferase A subunit family amidase